MPTTKTFPALVDYSLTLEEMLSKCNFDGIDENITSRNFSIHGTGRVVIEVIATQFNQHIITSEEVIDRISSMGYRPAMIEEFLAVRWKDAVWEDECTIICLGSVCTPYGTFVIERIPCVNVRGEQQFLSLSGRDRSRWLGKRCHFACIPIVKGI